MIQFRTVKANVEEQPPYLKQLPPCKQPYTNIIEMLNKKTQKRRILACESPAAAEEYVNLMNLVNSYLNYELLFNNKDNVLTQTTSKGDQKDQDKKNSQSQKEQANSSGANAAGSQGQGGQQQQSGPVFITSWVQNYIQHNGVMEFKEEVFDPENFPYLLSFGRENEAVKALVFNESFLFAGNEQRSTNFVQQVLSTFSRDSVTQIIFRGNFMVDQVLKQIMPSVSQYEKLTMIEISNNGLQNQALESLGIVFSNCPLINKINLSNNLLGQGPNQQSSLDYFLNQMLTELDAPQQLDFSDNKFTDESLAPIIKYIFANEDCKLLLFNLENNSFTSFGKRTLLKGYSLCQNKQQLQFRCGPIPFTEATIKHAFNVQYETKTVQGGKGKDPEQQKVIKSMNRDKLELRIVRKPNNYGSQFLRGLPINRADRDKLNSTFAKIESIVQTRNNVFIEDIRDLLQEISQLHFEFPRHKLEALFDVVNEKLFQSMECENIYCLEVLLDCLRYMNARNIKAEEKYQELSILAASVAKDLIKVINMELLDDNELNDMLDRALNEARRIGMRGEIIDVAVTLKMLRNNFLTEMQNKSAGSDDEGQTMGIGEDQQQLEFYDEDKTMNVYDEKYDAYIEMSAEELGLTSEVEANLGFHPLSADYLKISSLNLHYVKKNLKEAQKFLRDEESYAYRNIFDRCYFLLCDSNETPLQSKAYNLAKNDTNLKLARLIFRYRNNLDNLFPNKQEPAPQIQKSPDGRRKSIINPKPDDNRIFHYKYLLAKEYLEFNGTKLTHPVTKIDKNKAPIAVVFNRNLFSICEGDDVNKNVLYVTHWHQSLQQKIQEIFEEFVIKKGKVQNEDLIDEFYLQIFRQINRKSQSEKSAKAIANALFVLALFSRYTIPSKDLIDGYEQWMVNLREKTGSEFYRLISMIIQNFGIVKKADPNTKPYVNWPPCFAEIESIITGEPIQIQVFTPPGEVFAYTVDESTTVETLLQLIWKEKFFSKEPDAEFYWLYQHVDKSDQFDQPISKDKKILKLLYRNEKQAQQPSKTAQLNAQEDHRRFSFIKKKSTKLLRKQTIVSSMEALQDNEYQSTIFLIRKRILTSLHIEKNVKTLAKKALNFLYHQVRMDYIEKNVLRRLSSYEDVGAFGALILKVKYWGKILRSKDNSLTKELIMKNIDYAIPATFLREKSQDYWVQKIQNDFDRYNLRELSIEEAQEKFLNLFATYQMAYSSYYVLKAQPNNPDSILKQMEHDDSDEAPLTSQNSSRGSVILPNKESFLSMHLNHDLLCVININNGICFYENTKRDKLIVRINFEELLYVMGSSDVLKLGYINRSQMKNIDLKLELYTTNGQSARPIAEDVITYCQVKLAEQTKNDAIEVVKRNIINIFEDMEDPFAMGMEEDSSLMNSYPGSQIKKQLTTNSNKRKSNLGAFDFLGDGEQSLQGSPGMGEGYAGNVQQLKIRLQQQRGHQFRMREKFMIYLKKCPLYMPKVAAQTERVTETTQKSQPSRSSSSSISSLKEQTNRQSAFQKHQASAQPIEEDKEEDEDDSSYMTNEDTMKDNYNSNNFRSEKSYLSNNQSQRSPINQNPFGQKSNISPMNNTRSNSKTSQSSITQSQTKNQNRDDLRMQKSPKDLPPFMKKQQTLSQEEEQREGEAMVLGQKVNYNEMDKTQKKENLNNILSAAFTSLPPPPPPPPR